MQMSWLREAWFKLLAKDMLCVVHGWIEEISIHDILRDWCIEEARYAGFVDAIDNTSGQASCPLCVYRSLILNVFFGWLLRCYVL